MQVAQLLQQSENELIEFKEAKNQFDDNKLGRYCSALANEANLHHKPFAFLVLGVSDDKKIVGTTYCSGKNGSNEIKKKLADGLSERFNIQDMKLGKEESKVLINPASPMITWILKNEQGSEMDYEHFSCPLLLNVEKVFNKIRNLKYRYIKNGNLFPEEVEQYDPYIIREALHNAIAHQDYELGGKITLVECQNSQLYFTNSGRFIPQSIEMVLSENAPENRYRNRFLANAMVNINMIDTIGSGIRKMFTIQKERFFPLPEYQLSDQKVQVCIVGKVLDIAYAQKLASSPNLSLEEIMLLDKVQKKIPISDKAAKHLKSKKLIEGRKPNYYISATIAQLSDDEATYIHHKGLNDKYYQKLIIEYLQQFKTAKRKDFERLLLDKLPTALDENQKYHKIKNLLQSLKNQGIICNKNRIWQLSR
ncbi:ATP-binding protein [Avibacterium sp. 21-594]|uniref:ATP-binding protein n=1 Tax=Avibacterium sp. 21-594 TaxID=2911535 RepID=UPI002246EA52|nr:ATP-binding protein [Avibacterium sp. 21-594]MCW9715810.1 putative DNA binding domain-containing protein [Avibacterium sp. 21-594]